MHVYSDLQTIISGLLHHQEKLLGEVRAVSEFNQDAFDEYDNMKTTIYSLQDVGDYLLNTANGGENRYTCLNGPLCEYCADPQKQKLL